MFKSYVRTLTISPPPSSFFELFRFELFLRTYSDVPADPPQNVTLESASSKSLIVRWEPPPPESQNGIITGYKLRWRKGKGESEVVTTDGSRRLFAITGLKNGKEYQVCVVNSFLFGIKYKLTLNTSILTTNLT